MERKRRESRPGEGKPGGALPGGGRKNSVKAALAFALFAAAGILAACSDSGPNSQQTGNTQSAAQLHLETRGDALFPNIKHPEIGFASQQKFLDHYQKHGREFGRVSSRQYLQMAQDLRDRRIGEGVLEFKRRDGVYSRFDRKSGAFLAFNENLIIRTFFKPNDGEAYLVRQQRRDPR